MPRRTAYEKQRAPFLSGEARIASTGLCDCGHPPTKDPGSFSTGYGWDKEHRSHCFACCGERDRARMMAGEDPGLYISGGKDGRPVEVTNWPGTLRFRADEVRTTRIGFCLNGKIAYFRGPDGARWSARGPGLGMYARSRRLKSR